ncbi:hypothetical protein, partial [Acinetobacter pittii]|uniref:hypothetical protein n=1 Tax=Acinetobacter pittii TaxID=48296 RepID=UPI00281344B3
YVYTYTFPKADTYTITYRWTDDTKEIPEGVKLPAQGEKSEDEIGQNPIFTIETVSNQNKDEKWTFEGWYTVPNPGEKDEPVHPEGSA